MSNPAAAAAAPQGVAVSKTPRYAWVALAVSLFCAVAIVFSWMWLPAVTFPVFQGWAAANTPGYDPSGVANIMGLVPIGAIIMAFPTSILVRKWGAKTGTIIGLCLAILGMLICVFGATTDWVMFLAGRFVLGLGLSTTIVSGPTCVSIWFPHSTRGRGMAIWSCWAPIGIFTVNAIGSSILHMTADAASPEGNMVTFLWIWTILLVVALVLFAILFRNPRADESSEVSAETKSFKEVLPLFKSRQLWCLIIMFAMFNYMNYSFSQYLKTWLQCSPAVGGMGWDAGMAGLIGGAITACGILAPLGGFILDKTPKQFKYLCVVAGITGLTLASAFAFQNGAFMFALYIIFFCIGNMMLNGCCRPMVPTYVFKGGATAVALGLSFLTMGQYLGQIPTSYVMQPFIDSMSKARVLADGSIGVQVDPMLAFWALVPVGVLGIVLSFMMKPSKKEVEAMNKAGAGKPVGRGASGAGAPADDPKPAGAAH